MMVEESTVQRAKLRHALEIYGRAWVNQDPKLILTIFTKDAVYHERVLDDPIRGHAAIQAYWIEKVVVAQDNISFKLLNLYLDGSTGIAEWEVEFDDLDKGERKRMREIAVLEFESGKIASLREYWSSKRIGKLSDQNL